MDTPDQVPPPLPPGQPGAGFSPSGPPPIPRSYPGGLPTPAFPQPQQGMPRPPAPANDADQTRNPAIRHATEDTRTYPCPNCGGELRFDPASQGLQCLSCGAPTPLDPQVLTPSQIPKQDLATAMTQLRALQAQAATAVSMDKEIVCQACGGHTVFSGTLTTQRCPYCNTPIARDDIQASPTRLAIDGILPLGIDEKEARFRIEQWINSRRFAPNAFKKYREVGSFTSIYLPYFSYDSATTTDYSGQRGIHRTETYTDTDGKTHTRIVTDWYPASGRVNTNFEDMTGHASAGLNDANVEALEPWPLHQTCAYSPHIAAGHLTRTYDFDAEQVFTDRVGPRMESCIDSDIRQDIGGDEQRITWRDIHWHYLRFCQLALPIWMLTVTYKGKPFNVVINGLTGEVQGERPWSVIKIALAVIAALIVIAILVYFFGDS